MAYLRKGVINNSNILYPKGHVIQTIFNESTASTSITSTTAGSPTSTGLTCAITPKVAGSKILGLINIHLQLQAHTTSVADAGVTIKVNDGSSYIYVDGGEAHMGLYTYCGSGDPGDEIRIRYPTQFYIDASNTTARTYTVYAWLWPSSNTPTCNVSVNSSKSQFTLMEISD